MKKLTFLVIGFLLWYNFIPAQIRIAPNTYAVYFKDKKGSNYNINEPEKFLSPKAIARRKRLNIQITEQDLPVSSKYVKILDSIGAKVIETSKWLNCAVVKIRDTDSVTINKIKQLPFVSPKRYTQGPKKFTKEVVKYKPLNIRPIKFKKDYYDYGLSKYFIKMLKLNILHDLGYRGQDITMAVMDAGFYHLQDIPAFYTVWPKHKILGWYNFVEQDSNVFSTGKHGMDVLSCILGNIPGIFVGTAPEVNVYLFVTEDSRSEYPIEEYNFVCAAEKADSLGVDMIQASLGYSKFDDDVSSYTYDQMNGNYAVSTIGADIAASKGILVVNAAGNEGDSEWKHITAPSDGDSVLSVGALAWTEKVAFFSSRGPTADGRIKPDVCALGLDVLIPDENGNINSLSGTSIASPIIAGAVASLYSAFPQANPQDIIEAVKRSADRASDPNNSYGYGIPDMYKAYKYLMQKYKRRIIKNKNKK